MNRTARAVLGVLLGALLALAIHPYSRSRLLGPLWTWGQSSDLNTTRATIDSLTVLPRPKTLDDFGLWMEAGALRILNRIKTTQDDWRNLETAANLASQLDPQNGFWGQMASNFALAAKDRKGAESAWLRASKKSIWDDRQTARLLKTRSLLAKRFGDAGWTATALYPLRSSLAARAIEAMARDVARTSGFKTDRDLALRVATVKNGVLIRDGARSMRVAEVGMGMIELASYSGNLSSISSPRKLLLARAEFYEYVRQGISALAADEIDRAYRDNDSWLGYPTSVEASADALSLALTALVANGTVPVAMTAGVIGLFLALIAKLLETPVASTILKPPWVGVLAVGLAVMAYVDTGQFFLAVAAVSAFAFMAFMPPKERSRAPDSLGALHLAMLVVVGTLLVAACVWVIASNTVMGQAILSGYEVPMEAWGGQDPTMAGSLLAFCTLAIVSAFYGFTLRLSPARVFAVSLRKVGLGMACIGLAVCVGAAPLLLWIDRQVDQSATRRLENEPVHYYFEG